MFVIILTYKKPLTEVDQHLVAHRAYLDKCYAEKSLLMSGPQEPRIGGIIIATVKDKNLAQQIIEQDPFYIHNIANYQLIEFQPVKYQDVLAAVIM